jgi:hypothetical protein
MGKELNEDELNEIFDLEVEDDEHIEVFEEEVQVPKTTLTTSEDSVVEQLSNLLSVANSMLRKAEDLVMRVPDAESIAASSSMILAVHKLISEVNKSVLTDRRFDRMEQLEQLKATNKLQVIKARDKVPQIGEGASLTQNNFYNYSQEDLIDQIIKKERELQSG